MIPYEKLGHTRGLMLELILYNNDINNFKEFIEDLCGVDGA